MIKLEDIFVVFHPNTPLERVALRGINLEVKEGEIVSVVGNSGSGRTSLLKFLAGHIKPSFGRLWFNDVNISGQSIVERASIFSSVFYDHNVGTAESLTVVENLALASMYNQDKSFFDPAITSDMKEIIFNQLESLGFMGLEKYIDTKVRDIPKAHRQIIALLIAITKGAQVILIDEHSTGLDEKSSKALLEATEKIIKTKKITTIMALSDHERAFELADRTVVLSHGQVVHDLSGIDKQNMKIEELFSFFNIVPEIKDMES